MSPADDLRAAATLIRATASKATPGPWEIRDGNKVSSNVAARDERMVIDGGGWTDGTKAVVYGAALIADAAWIALMSPAVAEPLAAWLEATATDIEISEEDRKAGWSAFISPAHPALTVARAILGRSS